jgi:hypothetical protein
MSYTNMVPLLHEKYADFKDLTLDSEDISPVLSCFEANADDDGEGRGFIFPIVKSSQTTGGAIFATSQTKARGSAVGSASAKDRWVLNPTELHNFALFSRRELNAARKGGAGKMFDVVDQRFKDAVRDLRKQLAIAAVEAGYQPIGQSSDVTATTITFNPSVINRLDIGDTLVPSATEGGGVLLASAGSTTVTAYDPDTGIATVDTDTTTGGTPATDTSFWFRAGNREDAAFPTALYPIGIKGWIGSSTAIGGVTRTGNPNLTGHTVNASTGSLDHSSALLKMLHRLFKFHGAMEMTCFMSVEDHYVLSLDKEAIKNVAVELGPYKIGFNSIGVYGPNGKLVNVVCDGFLPQGTAYVGPFNDSKYRPQMKYSEKLIAIDDIDGNEFLRLDGSPNFEMRLYSNPVMCIQGPGYYGKITNLPSS